jgi:malate dehydrogenase
MTKALKRIAVTGGAGQIAYSILFRIASGDLLGKDQPIALHILDVPAAHEMLKGVVMELEDCAFHLLREVQWGADPHSIFDKVNYAFLIGAKPRGPGMERKELLFDNAKIFIEQGKALAQRAADDLLTLVVGNPCNTNCLITLTHAKRFHPLRFHAMTRLDQNRAVAMLAKKAGLPANVISRMTIWGNHSNTQVPDFINAEINHKPALEVIKERKWFEEEFIAAVQKRGAAVIASRGKSSAGSAANAAIDAMRSLIFPTPKEEWFSSACLSDENPYGIAKGIVFSFPCRSRGEGEIEIVKSLRWDELLREKIAQTEKELLEEREMIKHLL